MKKSKEYKAMMRHHKKAIMKQARVASKDPFDWGTGLELFVDHLYFMRDYYALGENVWAEEDCNWKSSVKYTRLEMLTQILDEYEEWMHCDEKYWGWDETDTTDTFMWSKRPTPAETGVHIRKLKNLVFEDDEENRNAYTKEYEEHRKNFFKLLDKYIELLWD